MIHICVCDSMVSLLKYGILMWFLPWCRPWSYHNAGSWPTLLWQVSVYFTKPFKNLLSSLKIKIKRFRIWWRETVLQLTVACIKMNRADIAAKAIEIVERRLSRDRWPEYYDTKRSRFIGKQARLFQTWSIAGYLVAKLLLADPGAAKILITDEDPELVNAFSCMIGANPRRKRGRKNTKQSYIVWIVSYILPFPTAGCLLV